ncbi:hypothetical protein BJV77DRAFT_1068576 [Russula vinacea]|nr:hypothetical protein BJV77DRAFT_1068576 [Russula vinacea]
MPTSRHLEAAYDGENSQEPTPKNKSSPPPLPFLPKPNTDPNLVKWDGPDDPENPQNWSFWYKSWITMVSTTATLNVTFASLAPSSSVPIIAHHFHVWREVGDLILSLSLIGYMLGPIFWVPFFVLSNRPPMSHPSHQSLCTCSSLVLGQIYTQCRLTRFKNRGVVTLYGELSTDMAFRGLAPCSPPPVSLNLNRPDSDSQSRQLWVMFKPPERAAPGRLGRNRCAAIDLKGSDWSLGSLYT